MTLSYFTKVTSIVVLLFVVWALGTVAQAEEPRESTWTVAPPSIDGRITQDDTWASGKFVAIPYGDLWILNDDTYVYLLIDLFCDTSNDHGMDFCSVWLRTSPTGGSLPKYMLCLQDSGEMRKYGDSSSPILLKQSHVATGFGPSIMPGFLSAKHHVSHRFVEIQVSLMELGASPDNVVDINLVVSSKNPLFRYGKEGFTHPIQIKLAMPPYVPGEVIVAFKEGVFPAEIAAFQSEFDLDEIRCIEGLGIHSYAIPSSEAVPAIVKILSKDPRVKYAEPNFFLYLSEQLGADNDWMEVSDLLKDSPEYQVSRAVGLLMRAGVTATGFLVGPDLILTAYHFVSTQEEAKETTLTLNAEKGNSSDEYEKYAITELVCTWSTWDISLLRCGPGPVGSQDPILPGKKWGYLSLSDAPLERGEPVYLIRQGDKENPYSKEISFGIIDDPTYGTRQATHDADTTAGSSGAPLLNPSTQTVVALHRGYPGGIRNVAIRLDKFVKELKRAGIWAKLFQPYQ